MYQLYVLMHASIRGHAADSADHDTMDSCPPAMQNRPFPTDNCGSYTAMKVNSNGLTTKETIRTSKGLRVKNFDDDVSLKYLISLSFAEDHECMIV